MPRSSPTRGWVREYAEMSLLEGVPPTVSAIRQRIMSTHGVTPSTSTVTNELALFWGALGRRLRTGKDEAGAEDEDEDEDEQEALTVPGLATSPVRAPDIAELTRLQYSNLELSAKVIRLTGELERLQKNLSEKDLLLSEAVLATGKAVKRTEEVEQRLNGELKSVERELGEKEDGWKREHVGLLQQLEKASTDLAAERSASLKAREQLDGARRHLMLETDRIRSQAEASKVGLKNELDTARIRESQYLQQLNRALARVDELAQALETARSQPRKRTSDKQDSQGGSAAPVSSAVGNQMPGEQDSRQSPLASNPDVPSE